MKSQGAKLSANLVPVIALMLVAGMHHSLARSTNKNPTEAGAQASLAGVAAIRMNSSGLPPAAPPQVERNPDREAYFGDEHNHTSMSLDAYLRGNHVTGPADSHKYWTGVDMVDKFTKVCLVSQAGNIRALRSS
jgi:hypothetical protein